MFGYRYILLPILFGLLFSMASCVDDLIIEEKPDPDTDISFDGYSIGFKFNLHSDLSSTRADGVEEYEDYIDTRNKFRVFFFTEDGDLLFGAIDRTITYLGEKDGEKNWYVRIPMNYLVDRDGNDYEVEKIIKYLKEKSFKVAILANWPNNGSKPTGNEDGTIDWNYYNRAPNWNAKNSCFYTGKDGVIKNINDLHHLVEDSFYGNSESGSDGLSRYKVYSFLMDNNKKMGVKQDWVKPRDINEGYHHPSTIKETPKGTFKENKKEAETWIRNNCDPSRDKIAGENGNYRNYDYLWQLWNFGGSFSNTALPYTNLWSGVSGVTDWTTQWQQRNGDYFRDYCLNRSTIPNFDYDGLKFVSNGTVSYHSHSTRNGWTYYYYYGIPLKKINTDCLDSKSVQEDKPRINREYNGAIRGYFKFKAPNSGKLRIKFSSSTAYTTARIDVQRNSTYVKQFTATGTTPIEKEEEIQITGAAEDVYIFTYSDTDAVIYAIEWICDRFLADTDREGIAPSEEQPIPMYGVQEFPALDDWKPGTTYDISADPTDKTKALTPISLIRSLAKVEVYLQRKPSHIYMRSMNRMLRCEPMDVETSTSETWKDNHGDKTDTKYCEFWDIQGYGALFGNGSEIKDDSELNQYQLWLSWFYGSWKNWEWDFKSHNGNTTVNVPPSSGDGYNRYPRIFNPVIQRSDFAHLLESEDNTGAGNYKYILYLPDRNISDANNPGHVTSTAKVPHIEYRYDNYGNSLEDNNCHRIYFTDYSKKFTTGKSINDLKSTDFDDYEQDIDFLNSLWPIMRNHVYRFYVGGDGSYEQTIRAEVSDWGYQKVEFTW